MPVRIVSTLLVALALAIASPRPAGAASGISLSDPVSYENLSVYFVRGPSSKAPAPLTLQEASAKGLVRIREMSTGSPMLDNLSDKPVFVPFGTLLTGGLQDQVVARSLFVGPGATGIALSVFCVERGRSVKRQGDDEAAFTIADALLPSRVAKLALLSGGSQSRVTEYVRQIGVWLTVASMKESFAAQLNEPIQSPRSATSLPLALEHPGVSLLQAPYVEALRSSLPGHKDVVGAVFAVNGKLSSAEIYGSHALFQKMWPNLLRAYAAESAIAKGLPNAELPSRAAALAFVTKTEQAAALAERTATAIRVDAHASLAKSENESGVFAGTQTARRGWSHKSFVAKAELPASPMEAAVLRVLAENLADATFTGPAARVEIAQLATWLAQQTDSPEAAMQQATAARILEPRPAAVTTYDTARRDSIAYAADRSADTKMVLLALALCALLSRIALRVLAGVTRRLHAATHALALQLRSRGAQLVGALRNLPAGLAAKALTVLMPPRVRVRYAFAVHRRA